MKLLKPLVSAILLGLLAWRTDWAQVADAFGRLQLGPWLAAMALYALTQLVSAWRWQLLARPLGFEQPLRHFAGYYFIGMFFNLVLPTSVGGDVVRAWYLDDRSDRRVSAFLSVLVDRGSGLLVLLALACVAAVLCPIELPRWIYWSVGLTAGIAALGLGGICIAGSLLKTRSSGGTDIPVCAYFFPFTQTRMSVPPIVNRFFHLQSAYLHRSALLIGTTLLSVLIQCANIVLVWLVGQAIDAPVPGAYYWIAVPMVTLLTLLPISLNGMGLREGGLILFLQPLGVPAGTALSLAFLWFLAFAAVSLLGGGVYLFGRFPRPEVKNDHGPVRGYSDQGRAGQYRAAA